MGLAMEGVRTCSRPLNRAKRGKEGLKIQGGKSTAKIRIN